MNTDLFSAFKLSKIIIFHVTFSIRFAYESSGALIKFDNWQYPDQPDNDNADCAAVINNNAEWADENCTNSTYSYICEDFQVKASLISKLLYLDYCNDSEEVEFLFCEASVVSLNFFERLLDFSQQHVIYSQ